MLTFFLCFFSLSTVFFFTVLTFGSILGLLALLLRAVLILREEAVTLNYLGLSVLGGRISSRMDLGE
jgi:hypothetical protein